jgi:hypothetical protein
MIKSVIGNGGHSSEVMAQMGTKIVRFVDNQYINNNTLTYTDLSKFDVYTKANRE